MEGKGDLSDPEREDKSIGSFSPKGKLSPNGKNLGGKPFRSFKEALPSGTHQKPDWEIPLVVPKTCMETKTITTDTLMRSLKF